MNRFANLFKFGMKVFYYFIYLSATSILDFTLSTGTDLMSKF